MWAGSSGGPTSTKSLCMTGSRLEPWPSAMNFSSAFGECTRSTSALPLSPMAIACPEPTATVFGTQSEFCSNVGRIASSNPESWVLVVVARIMSPVASAAPSAPGGRSLPHPAVTSRPAARSRPRHPQALSPAALHAATRDSPLRLSS